MSETTASSGRYPPAPRIRRAAPVALTLVHSVSRTITIAGFPLSTWAFALRIWAAVMVALYAAFWLQLESASSARRAASIAVPWSGWRAVPDVPAQSATCQHPAGKAASML